ncbi:MAG: autotransporter-associated beta strand repeat-containing protein [Thermoguttaceae bacterium]
MTAGRRVAIAWILVLWSTPAPAIQINDFTAARNDRFASGYVFTSGTLTGTPVGNLDPSFIGLGYDWSGVGWVADSAYTPYVSYALLTPRQMLVANHYSPLKLSAPNIQFVSAAGQVTNATVQSEPGAHSVSPTFASDMATAQFSSAIPQSAGITTYSILFQGYNPSTYAGFNLLSYGWTAEIGWNQIASVNTGTAYNWGTPFTPDSAYYENFLYDTTTPDRTQLEGNDSGSPSFIVTGSPGVMYLAGAHYLNEPNISGWDSFLPLSLPTLDSYTSPAGYLPSVVTPTTARWLSTSSTNWGAGSNWSGGAVPNDILNSSGQVTACASVLFDGLASSLHSITLSGTQAVTSLDFNLTPSTTSGFAFSGASLTLGEAGLTNNDIHTLSFNNAIILRASQQWNVGTGGLTISTSGSLSLETSQLLYLNGSGTGDFEGVISGDGSGIAKDGSGTLILGNANNSFSGQLFVHNGTLQFASIQDVGGGNSALGAPTNVANGTIYLAGTLAYVGSGHSSDRVIDVADGPGAVGATTGTVDASGAGALTLTGGVICENYSNSYGGASTLVLQGSGSGFQSGIISSNGLNVMSLVKTGSGTWNLSGANTYSGTTAVNGGLLTVSGVNGSIGQSTALTVSGGTVQLDDSTLSSGFSSSRLGNQPITLQGGALSLNLGNISGGTETIGSVTAAVGENTLGLATSAGTGILNAGSLTRMPGATLDFTGSLSSGNGMVFSAMASGSNFIDAGTFVNGADYAVYDAGGYTRAMVVGSNAWDYALNSVTGSRHVLLTTPVTSQPSVALLTLSLSGAGTSFTMANTATLTLSAGGILKTGGGPATVGGGTGISTTGEYVLRANSASDQLDIMTPLSGGTGLTKSGLGTLVLGALGNSYNGTTTIDAGTLKTSVAGAIPATSPLVIANAASLDLSGQAQTVAGITLYDGSVLNSGANTVLTLDGIGAGVTYAGVGNGSSISGGTLNLASIGAGDSHTFAVARGQGSVDLNILASIADGAFPGQSLLKTGNGILQLSGTNSFTGGTQIQAGALALGSNDAIPAASSLTLSAGTLNLGGYANTAGTLVMQGGLICGNGSFGTASFNLQNGTLYGSLVGAGSLSKTTSGVVTISSSNNYSGGTTLSGGTLVVSADNNLGSTAGALTLDGGTLQVLGTSFSSTTRLVTSTSNGGGISVADPNNTLTLAAQNLSGSGVFTKAGQGALQLGGSVGSAAITVQDGILQLNAGSPQLTGNPAISLGNVADLNIVGHNETISSINMTGGTINTGTGTLNLTGSLNYARSIWPATIQGNLSLGTSAGTFSVNQGSSTDLTVAANISGNPDLGLVKMGNGLLTISGTNTYSGGTTIGSGTLQVGTGNASGTLGSGPVIDNGALSFNLANTLTVSNPITGSGAVTLLGGGTIILTGNNTYSGGTTINASNLQIGSDGISGPLGSGPVTNNSSVLSFELSGLYTVPGAINGSGELTQLGPGTLVLNAGDSYTGRTTISGGALQANSGAGLPSMSGLTLNGGVLESSGSFARSIGGGSTSVLWSSLGGGFSAGGGSLSVDLNSGGALTWGGSSSSILYIRGTLMFGSPTANNQTDFVNPLNLNNSTDTAVNRTVQVTAGQGGDFAVMSGALSNSAGTAGLVKTGAGLLLLSGSNSYNGGTQINAGNVVFSSASSIPNNGLISINAPGALDVTGAYSTVTGWLSSGKINVGSTGALALSGMSNETINMGAYRNLALGAAAAGATYSGVLTPSGSTFNFGGGGGELSVTSNLTGPNSLVVGSSGPGTVVLSGTNTYSDGTTVTSGTLEVLNNLALPDGALMIGAGAGQVFAADLPPLSFPAMKSLDILSPFASSMNSRDPARFSGPGTGSLAAPRATSQRAADPVPEPGTLALLGTGMLALFGRVRRWRK